MREVLHEGAGRGGLAGVHRGTYDGNDGNTPDLETLVELQGVL